jgi:ABC-type multidrug transport system fused ATPase/permease subunit
MSILQNIYPLNNGQVFIGDYSINHISNSSLRRIIGVVPQKMGEYYHLWSQQIPMDFQNYIQK